MKPTFVEMVTLGRTLVVVQTALDMGLVKRVLAPQVLIPVLYGDVPSEFEARLAEFQTHRIFKNYGVLVLNQASCHGFHVRVDRVIWVGPEPLKYSQMEPQCRQAMGRGNTEYGQPAKWFYSAKEIQ